MSKKDTPSHPVLPMCWRLAGLIPLATFFIHLHRNWSLGAPEHAFWMCHVSNVMLGIGALAAVACLIRLAVLWMLVGIPMWIMYTMQTGDVPAITLFTHLVSPAVGLMMFPHIRASRNTWLWAIPWFLFIQQLTRLYTPPELNINVAHQMYPGWEKVFGAYWQYWLFVACGSGFLLWGIGRTLYWFFPPAQPVQADVEG